MRYYEASFQPAPNLRPERIEGGNVSVSHLSAAYPIRQLLQNLMTGHSNIPPNKK